MVAPHCGDSNQRAALQATLLHADHPTAAMSRESKKSAAADRCRIRDRMTASTNGPRWFDRASTRYGTPCYVNRARRVLQAVEHLERGDGGVRSWLSYKTHPLPRLVEWWIASGRGVEVVSEIEFAAAYRLGCSPDQLLVNGPR